MTVKSFAAKGYCTAMTKVCASLDGSGRIEYLERHVPTCEPCRFANLMNNIEYRCAEVVGPEAVARWRRGEPQSFPAVVMDAVMAPMLLMHLASDEERTRFKAWLNDVITKHHAQ